MTPTVSARHVFLRYLCGSIGLICVLNGFASVAYAQMPAPPSREAPDIHELAAKSQVMKKPGDFSDFLYRPPGDRVIEQPSQNRLIFRRPDGSPDGYAERRGDAIIYYDRFGKIARILRRGIIPHRKVLRKRQPRSSRASAQRRSSAD